jgi:hypothetical protein
VVEMMWRQLTIILLQILIGAAKPDWRWGIHEALTIVFALVLFFVELLVLTIVLYLAGLIVVGRKRALISDAFIIALLGTLLSTLFVILLPNWIAILLIVIVWLILIKRLYETGWLGAIAVGILAIVIYLAVLILVAIVFGTLAIIIKWLTSILV